MTAGPQQVKVDLDAFGHGSVEVGGLSLSESLKRITIDSSANEPTRVYLELRNGMTPSVELEALIGFHEDPGAGVLDFLQNVDIIALEAAAMEKLEGLDGTIESPMAAAVIVLQEWAAAGVDDHRT